MEALAAVGLAANVLQFVQFGFELFSISSAIRKNSEALPVGYADLEIISNNLDKHIKALSGRCDPDLQALVDRARQIAVQLLDTLDKLKMKGIGNTSRNNKWGCFRQALEVILKKGAMEDLISRLKDIREQIQFHFVVELRNAQRNLLLAHQNLDNEMGKVNQVTSTTQSLIASRDSDLFRKLSGMVIELEKMNSRLESIESQENSVELGDVLRNLQESVLPLRDQIAKQKISVILKSLQFSSMTIRHSRIIDAHRKTFEWVFKAKDLSEDDPRSRVTLADWLRSGKGIYWITGKPGSGKSTLMKFLEEHLCTSIMLNEWAGGACLVNASFYFWNAGTEMQKSIEGLLQSLLYTIFSNQPDLVTALCPERITSSDHQTKAVWSLTELRTVFDRLVRQQHESTRFYFHIDGLDEYKGNPNDVIEIVEKLAQKSTYKVCVSSRPWNEFRKNFGQSTRNTLELHLFTKEDIERFARECLYPSRTEFEGDDVLVQYANLVGEISQRAQGVFLWVRLVVRSLRDGQFNRDPVSILKRRLNEMPTDLEEFFQQILQSVDPVYGERMARTFLTALASPEPLKIIHYSSLDEDDPYMGWKTEIEPMSQEQINMRVTGTRWRLNGRYKGLLEPGCNQDSYHVTVDFLHRTLRDFLLTSRVKSYLEARVSRDFNPKKAAVGTLLAEVRFFSTNLRPQSFAEVLEFADRAESMDTDTRTPNPGVNSRAQSMEFDIMDHIEAICRAICIKTSQPILSPGPILRAALHHQKYDYVKCRMQKYDSPSDLNWILLHLTCYTERTKLSFSQILGFSIARLNSCECTLQGSLGEGTSTSYLCSLSQDAMIRVEPRKALKIDLISEVMLQGVDPNAKVHNVVIWTQFLEVLESQAKTPFCEDYWKVLRLLVEKGADSNAHMALWMRMINQIPSMADTPLLHLLEGLIFLLERGLKVNTELWLTLLFRMSKTWETPRRQVRFRLPRFTAKNILEDSPGFQDHSSSLYRKLFEMLLRRGANVSGIVDRPPGHIGGHSSWFDGFLNELETNTSYTYTEDAYTLFKILFENGLDPNHETRGSTIWELLLEALSPVHYHWSTIRLLVVFLQHRADPSSAKLHQILGWTPGYTCRIREPEASELKLAVKHELADLKQRDELLRGRSETAPRDHQSKMCISNLLSSEDTRGKRIEKRTYPYDEQYVNSSSKKPRRY